LVSFALFSTFAVSASADTSLTAELVAERAQSTSHELLARAEEAAAARAGVDQALASYLPRLQGTARYTRLSDVPATSLGNLVLAPTAQPGSRPDTAQLVAVPVAFASISNQYLAQASLQIPLSDYLLRLPQLHAAASGNARASELVAKATRQRIGTDARVAYFTWLRGCMQTAIAEQSLELARGHLQDVTHAAEVGAASKADVLRVEAQVASAELMLTRARDFAAVAETSLRTLMHDPSSAPYQSSDDLTAEVAEDLPEAKPEVELWSEAAAHRLELHALAESAGALRQQAKAALVAGLPRLDAVGNAVYANPNPRIFPQQDQYRGTWDATIQLSWSPTELPGVGAARRSALAKAAQLEEQRAATVDAIKIEVSRAAHAVGEARMAIGSATRAQRAAEESCRIRRSLFQNGRATSVELTDAETELTRARIELLNARIELRVAHAQLMYALGRAG
jgi:outer membrane protein TolC